MTESLGKLGPHEGQELELLLSGKKPIAYFYELLP
ncbi:hemin receptor, partial [Acinetobacter baumannii]|nr:hemin receptor [Acinetobacter baumannii]MCW1284325.1 hemin receptor [Acinetobacter baumannii]